MLYLNLKYYPGHFDTMHSQRESAAKEIVRS